MTAREKGATDFEALRQYRAFEAIVDEVHRRIDAGQLTSGQRLPPERELAAQFGVSRATLREAFRVLESMSLIESRMGSGRYVATRPKAEATRASLGETALVPFVEFLQGIEPYLAGLAAQRATEDDLARIAATLQTSDRTPLKTARSDTNFHLAVTRAARNVVARDVLHSERAALYWADLWVSVLPDAAPAIASEHRAIFAAIAAHDDEGARRAMAAHLDFALQRIRDAARLQVNQQSAGGSRGRDA
jgi:GntR family transcriptional regulator, transcriptional repressor for pyruvate dehydrogenase complex